MQVLASPKPDLGVQVAAINTAMGSLVKTCTTFPAERTIVTRERSKRSYDMGPYFLAKLLAELPVGALFPAVFGTLVYPTTGLHPKWSRSPPPPLLHADKPSCCLACLLLMGQANALCGCY